jgi:hypothetical protein
MYGHYWICLFILSLSSNQYKRARARSIESNMIRLHFIGLIAQSHRRLVCNVCMSMNAMRQNIDIVVVQLNMKMYTYDSHVQEFLVCYIVDDLMRLKENNMFD